MITRHGQCVMQWGDTRRRYDLKSTTKSFGATALGLALADGKLTLEDRALQHHPGLGVPPESNRRTGWIEQITVQHLATQTAGFAKPGGYTELQFAPGSKWAYSDGGPNWLAECITLRYRRDLSELMFERVFTPLHITPDDLTWRRNQYRPARIDGIGRREFGSGIHANADAMARLGLLYLREGRWQERQILPRTFVAAARTTVPSVTGLPEADAERYGNASEHYGLLWWNNADRSLSGVPADAFWSWGLHESLILVVPSLDVVVSRAGRSWKREWDGHYTVLKPFFEPIAASVYRDK
jgi:CubicO group peptidase (beta-lactamase class C family)